jgi:hypothetical protein
LEYFFAECPHRTKDGFDDGHPHQLKPRFRF